MKNNKSSVLLAAAILALALGGCADGNVGDKIFVSGNSFSEEPSPPASGSPKETIPGETYRPWTPPVLPTREPDTYDPGAALEYSIGGAVPIYQETAPELLETVRQLMEERRELECVVQYGRSNNDAKETGAPAPSWAKPAEIGGGYYTLILYMDIRCWDDFEALLERVYTKEYVDGYFIPQCLEWGGETPLFAERDGRLYHQIVGGFATPLVMDSMRVYRMAYWEDIYFVSVEVDYEAARQKNLNLYILQKNDEKPYGFEITAELEFDF